MTTSVFSLPLMRFIKHKLKDPVSLSQQIASKNFCEMTMHL